MTSLPAAARTADARNRALRAFLQGLAWDVLAAIAATIVAVVTSADAIAWTVLGAAVVKTLLVSAASYVMRAKLDPSSFPTPLPPSDPGPPVEPDDDEHTLEALGEDARTVQSILDEEAARSDPA